MSPWRCYNASQQVVHLWLRGPRSVLRQRPRAYVFLTQLSAFPFLFYKQGRSLFQGFLLLVTGQQLLTHVPKHYPAVFVCACLQRSTRVV